MAGRRTCLTYPGSGLYVDYDYLTTGEMTKARENGATSGVGVLATFAYDNIGRRSSLTRGNGTVTSYAFDAVSRLSTLAENMTGTGQDQSVTFSYNPASQITSLTKTNDTYAWTGHGNGSTASVANGLNQLSSIGGTATTHDARGNVTFDPMSGKTYGYASENLLTSASGGTSATLGYDPAMRLYQVSATATTRFLYDGVNLIGEYDGSNVLQKRYVFGPGIDEPLVQYDASATRSWLHADERGSIIAISDGTGTVTQINAYDEYGKPQGTNVGRFQYTGQTWLPEIGAYYYKARIYSPVFGGRFLQTDPIGTEGGINLYAYVGNDPVNWIDPSGMLTYCTGSIIPRNSCDGSVSNLITIGGHWELRDHPDPYSRGGEIVVTGSKVWVRDYFSFNLFQGWNFLGSPRELSEDTLDVICTSAEVLDKTGKVADGVAIASLGASLAAARARNPYLAGFYANVASRAFIVSRLTSGASVPLNLAAGNYLGAAGNVFGAASGKTSGLAVEKTLRTLVGAVPRTKFGKELVNTSIANAVGSVGECK